MGSPGAGSSTDASPGARLARWPLYLLAFALPVVFFPWIADVFGLPKTIVMVVVSVVVLVGILIAARGPRTPWRSPGLDILAAYIVLDVAATLHSEVPAHSLIGERYQYQGLLATLAYAVAFIAARRALATDRSLGFFASAVVAGGTFAAIYGLLQQMGLDPIWQGELYGGTRIFSTMGQSNALAAVLVMAIPLATPQALRHVGMARVVFTAAVVLMAAALVLSLSRGGYLGAAAAAIVFVAGLGALRLRESRDRALRDPLDTASGAATVGAGPAGPAGPARTGRRPRRAVLAVATVGVAVLLVGVAAVTAMTLGSTVGRRVATIGDASEPSTAGHLDLMAVGIRIALDYPVLGIGPEMYPAVFPGYRDRVLPADQAAILAGFRPESPHDVPLAIADGAGIPALALYVLLIVVSLVSGARRFAAAPRVEALLLAGVLAAVAGHLVTDLFMTAEPAGSWIFWALLGALASAPAAVEGHARQGARSRPSAGLDDDGPGSVLPPTSFA